MTLRDFKWYRRWKGGIWWLTVIDVEGRAWQRWSRPWKNKTHYSERVIATEDYATLKPKRGVGDLCSGVCRIGYAPFQSVECRS
jgi:hypothetical protein